MHDIHKAFKIHNKVVLTTTDSGSNFVKAFKVFGIDLNLNSLNELNIIVPTVEEEKEEDIEYISIDNILDVALDVEDATGFQLPPHRRCITHTLNLVATTDIEKWISSNAHTSNIKTLKTIFRSCLAKCTKLWSKQNQSSIVAEQIYEQFTFHLKVPNKTRWNALFDALTQIKKIFLQSQGIDMFNKIMDFCELTRFTQQEIQFISEYCDIMEPIATSLDFLQGEKAMYLGFTLPVLHALKKKMLLREKNNLLFCKPLVQCILTSIDKR